MSGAGPVRKQRKPAASLQPGGGGRKASVEVVLVCRGGEGRQSGDLGRKIGSPRRLAVEGETRDGGMEAQQLLLPHVH